MAGDERSPPTPDGSAGKPSTAGGGGGRRGGGGEGDRPSTAGGRGRELGGVDRHVKLSEVRQNPEF
jgi:hypothetical protein